MPRVGILKIGPLRAELWDVESDPVLRILWLPLCSDNLAMKSKVKLLLLTDLYALVSPKSD